MFEEMEMIFSGQFALMVAALTSAGAALAHAGGHDGNPAANARHAHMKLHAFNLDVLGAMAKGEFGYNADAAKATANNPLALAMMNQDAYWAPRTSVTELGNETRALPSIWEDGSRFRDIGIQLVETARQLAATAGEGQDTLRTAIRGVGGACSAGHRNYRQRWV